VNRAVKTDLVRSTDDRARAWSLAAPPPSHRTFNFARSATSEQEAQSGNQNPFSHPRSWTRAIERGAIVAEGFSTGETGELGAWRTVLAASQVPGLANDWRSGTSDRGVFPK
jgi:hypothetical protein